MSNQIKTTSTTNILLAVIAALLAFLCINQKLSSLKSQENQEKLHTLIKRHASYVEVQHLKEEGRRLAFANHFAGANLSPGEIGTKEGDTKLLKMGEGGINACLSMPSNSGEIITGIKSYVSNSPLYAYTHALYFSTPSSYAELPESKDKNTAFNKENNKEEKDGLDK